MPFWRGNDPDQDDGAWLVVGLGNPGPQYERTRHNVGFMVVEALAERAGVRFKGSRHRADVARRQIQGVSVLLAQPLTFMNESGLAVTRLTRYYKIPPERLLVICDDIDLPFGTLRLRPSGSSGGNRGLQSIIECLQTEQFARLRVGVERPKSSAVGHVLSAFPREQARVLPALIGIAADAVTAVLEEGVPVAMNRFNRNWLGELST
jgi:peptidyl-tRNA hydrolase, PTH1 family